MGEGDAARQPLRWRCTQHPRALCSSQKATPRPRGNVPGAAQGDRATEVPQILSVWCLPSQPLSWAHSHGLLYHSL